MPKFKEAHPQRPSTIQALGHEDGYASSDEDADDSTNVSVDRPEEWVFRHHKPGLICKIKQTRRWPWLEGLRSSKVAHDISFVLKRAIKAKSRPDKPNDRNWKRLDKDNSFRISLAELQRIHLRKLQCKLVKAVREMRIRKRDPGNWEGDLKLYIEAIKDYDYMIERSKSTHDPFLVTGERNIDDYVIQSILGDLAKTKKLSIISPIGGTRAANVAQSALTGLKNRLATAALGGAFLVGPMWLMVKRADLNTSLVSTTLFVVVFGLLMAAYLDKSKDVMSATAAYAAVLVVFVGLGAQLPASTPGSA
ncbi:hypothetical protein PG989_006362 [Apiospora arundinis]